MIRRGMLYWVVMPNEKQRPALVLSHDRRNELASNIVVVPCSSQLRFGPWHVELSKKESGLSAPSVLRCEDIQTVSKDRVRTPAIGGPLSATRLEEVRRALLSALAFES